MNGGITVSDFSKLVSQRSSIFYEKARGNAKPTVSIIIGQTNFFYRLRTFYFIACGHFILVDHFIPLASRIFCPVGIRCCDASQPHNLMCAAGR
jgi:hypothetical protein